MKGFSEDAFIIMILVFLAFFCFLEWLWICFIDFKKWLYDWAAGYFLERKKQSARWW